jgi:hypothetical protein
MSVSGQIGRLIVSLEADTTLLEAGLRRGESLVSGGAQRIDRLLRAGVAIGAGVTTFNAGLVATRRLFDLASNAIVSFNSKLDDTAVTWEVFLGSASKAQAEIKTLYDFAAKTPFNFQEVQEGAIVLQLLGGAALNTTKNLTLFGDAAIAVSNVAGSLGEAFQQVTFYAARLYSELNDGTPIGRTVLRMQQLGLVTGQTVATIQLFQEEGATATATYDVFLRGLERFAGINERVQRNFSVAIATFGDYLRKNVADVGRPIFDTIKQVLAGVNDLLAPDNVGTQRLLVQATAAVKTAVTDIAAFFKRADVQDTIKTWALALRDFGGDAIHALGEVAKVLGPFLAGLVRGAAVINEFTGKNVVGFGLLLAAGYKYSDFIKGFIRLLTGQVTLLNQQYDAEGRVLTRKQQAEKQAELHARALQIEALATQRLTDAEAKLTDQYTREDRARRNTGNADAAYRGATARQATARAAQSTAGVNVVAARAALTVAQSDVTALGGVANAEALAKEFKGSTDLTVAQARLAIAQTEATAATARQTTALLDQAVAAKALAAAEIDLARLRAYTALQEVTIANRRAKADAASSKVSDLQAQIKARETALLASDRRIAVARQAAADKVITPEKLTTVTKRETSRQTAERAQITTLSAQRVKAINAEKAANDALAKSLDELTRRQGFRDTASAKVGAAKLDVSAAEAQVKAQTKALNNAVIERTAAQLDLDKTNDIIARGGAGAAKALAELQARDDALTAANRRLTTATRELGAANKQVGTTFATLENELDGLKLQMAATARAEAAVAAEEKGLIAAQDATVALSTKVASFGTTAAAAFSKLGQIGLIIGVTIVALNQLSQALFKVDFLTLAGNIIQYGDTLAYARQQADAFAKAQIGLAAPEVNTNYNAKLKETQNQLDALIKRRDMLNKLAAQNPATGSLPFTSSGRQLIGEFLRNPGEGFGGLDSSIDNLKKLYQQLQDDEKAYGVEIDKINQKKLAGNALTQKELELLEGVNFAEQEREDRKKGRGSFVGPLVPNQAEIDAYNKNVADQLDQGITSAIVDKGRALFAAGGGLFKQFADGFTADEATLYADMDNVVTELLKRASPTNKIRVSDQITLQGVEPLLEEAAKEVKEVGSVSETTFNAIAAGLPKAFDVTVLRDYFDQLAKIEALQKAIAVQQAGMAIATGAWAIALAAGNAAIQAETDKIADMTEANKKDQRTREDEIRGLQDHLKGVQEEADAVARGYEKVIKAEQEELRVIQANADARRQAAQEAIDAQQKVVEADQKAADQHAGAYTAVLQGETAEYLKQQGDVDDLTRKIIARWEADIAGARRLKDATADKATELDRENRKKILGFDEQIYAARQKGDYAAAARLTRQRDDYNKRAQRDISLAHERAGVAQDEFDIRAEKLAKEAKGQKDLDDAKTKAAQAELDILKARDAEQTKAEDAVIKQKQEQIRLTQAEADTKAQAYADELRNEQAVIDKKTREKEDADRAAQDAIDNEGKVLTKMQKEFDNQKEQHDLRVDAANKSLTAAQAELLVQQNITTEIGKRIKDQNDYIDHLLAIVDALVTLGAITPSEAEILRTKLKGGGTTNTGGTLGGVPGTGLPTGGDSTPPSSKPAGDAPSQPTTIGGQPGTGLDPGTSGGGGGAAADVGYPPGTLEQLVNLQTSGQDGDWSRRTKLALMMGAILEGGSFDGPWAAGDGGHSHGPYQVNDLAHPDWPEDKADNLNAVVPAMAAGTITKTGYIAAAHSVPERDWLTNPGYAAAYAAFLAEKPAAMYPDDRIKGAFAQARNTAQFWNGGLITEHVVGVGLTTGTRYELGERGPEFVLPLPAVPPDIPTGPHLDGASWQHQLHRGQQRADVGAGAGQTVVHGPIWNIERMDAHNPDELNAAIALMGEQVLELGIAGLSVAKRGGIVRGQPRRGG